MCASSGQPGSKGSMEVDLDPLQRWGSLSRFLE